MLYLSQFIDNRLGWQFAGEPASEGLGWSLQMEIHLRLSNMYRVVIFFFVLMFLFILFSTFGPRLLGIRQTNTPNDTARIEAIEKELSGLESGDIIQLENGRLLLVIDHPTKRISTTYSLRVTDGWNLPFRLGDQFLIEHTRNLRVIRQNEEPDYSYFVKKFVAQAATGFPGEKEQPQ